MLRPGTVLLTMAPAPAFGVAKLAPRGPLLALVPGHGFAVFVVTVETRGAVVVAPVGKPAADHPCILSSFLRHTPF